MMLRPLACCLLLSVFAVPAFSIHARAAAPRHRPDPRTERLNQQQLDRIQGRTPPSAEPATAPPATSSRPGPILGTPLMTNPAPATGYPR